ncbi:helix-turn-helix domain-containing protein [Bradyrhizobium sp. McL0616]|uniref:helix-turn-helix domain-containing protein n=1 Tax=Bradyrhizobium sp. McL0616 TaxID=3415674 RepID=UPI003CFB7B19
MVELSPRAARIKAATETAFGLRGLTQLAAAAGVSQQLLSFIVRGDRIVSDDVYRKVADALLDRPHAQGGGQISETAGRMFAELKE